MTADLALILPELILTIGALVADAGRRLLRRRGMRALISWARLLRSLAAAAALIALSGVACRRCFSAACSRPTPSRLRQAADLCRAPRSAILVAPRWFERDASMRAEYPVLILFAAVGMGDDGLGGRPDDALCRPRAHSLAAYVLASFLRTDERSAEAGLKYFVLGALASGILLYGISLLYGFTGTTSSPASPTRSGGEHVDRAAVRPRLRARRPRLQDQRGAVPHVDARRLRRRADPGHRLLRLARPRSRRWRCSARVAVDALGPAIDAWRQIVIFAALASIILGAVARDRADQHQAAARLFLDQQCRLRADRPCRGRRRGRRVGAVLHGRLCRDDARRVPRACCGCATRTASRSRASPACPACRSTRPGWPRRWRSSCSAWPAFRRCSASGRSWWCSTRRWTADLVPAGGGRHRGLGDRRLLLHQDRQDDVLRRAGGRALPAAADARRGH